MGVLRLLCALTFLLVPRLAFGQASCASTYTNACIGSTVCFTATGTSAQVIPPNLYRRYLLIQGQSASTTVYYAIGNPPSNGTLTAVIGTNTIALVPPGNNQLPNYEVSSLNATAGPPPRVPTGAVTLITGGSSVGVCITEANG